MNSTLKNESGMTLTETLMAILILTVGLLTMAQVIAFSVIASKTHGRDSGKATAIARDKIEELTSLQFADTTSDVTVAPISPAGGVGLTAGGSTYPDAPVDSYHDCLNATGNRTTDPNSIAFTRQWRIDNASANLKTITVSVVSNKSFQYGAAPSTVLITQKAP